MDNRDASTKPTIHYLWIGPPPSDAKADTVSHIVDMKHLTANPVEFYCLDKHCGHYQEKFKDTGVTVKSIQGLLNQCAEEKSELSELAKKVLKILETTIANPVRNKIPDRTYFKDVFALFLTASIGGYAIDRNVRPLAENKDAQTKGIAIPSPPHFCYPTYGMTAEAWMMYSPDNERATAQKLLAHYLNNWDKAQAPLHDLRQWAGESEYPLKFHKNMEALVIDTLMQFDPTEETDKNPLQFELFTAEYRAQLTGFPVEKMYGNSHKHAEVAAFHLDMEMSDQNNTAAKPSAENANKQIALFKAQLVEAIQFGLKSCLARGAVSNPMKAAVSKLQTQLQNPASTFQQITDALSEMKSTPTPTNWMATMFSSSNVDEDLKRMAARVSENYKNRSAAAKIVKILNDKEQKQAPEFSSKPKATPAA